MVRHFGPKCNKFSKMGSECQIFTRLRDRIIISSDMKLIMNLKEIPRNGFNRYMEVAPSDLLILQMLI